MNRIELALWGVRIKAAGTLAVVGAVVLAALVVLH